MGDTSILASCKQMPQTVKDLRNRLACMRYMLETDFEAAAQLDAHRTGGSLIGTASLVLGLVKVAAIRTRSGQIRTLAIAKMGNQWVRVKERTVLQFLGDVAIDLAIKRAAKKWFDYRGIQVGEGHIDDSGIIPKAKRLVYLGLGPMDAVSAVLSKTMDKSKTATAGTVTV